MSRPEGQITKIVSEFDQEILQSQTEDKPHVTVRKSHTTQETLERQTKQSDQLSLSHQDDCKTKMDIK